LVFQKSDSQPFNLGFTGRVNSIARNDGNLLISKIL